MVRVAVTKSPLHVPPPLPLTPDPSLPWSVSLADFPHPSLATSSAVGRYAPTFLLAAVTINFLILLTAMVRLVHVHAAGTTSVGWGPTLSHPVHAYPHPPTTIGYLESAQAEERESGTRGALAAMGLRDSAHWVRTSCAGAVGQWAG